mmetsp:Transcript_110548/g.191602  ORF Transcript_110548/g.191602 Transcript_110548/m.191602 type:complete len:251 (+) Transcript_110548:228-980(+)
MQQENYSPASNWAGLVAVVLRLEGSRLGDIQVLRLLWAELRQLDAQFAQVVTCNLLVELLGEQVDTNVLVLVGLLVGPQFHLCQNLVAERVGHDEGRVASGTTQIHKATFSKKDDVPATVHGVTVNLGLDFNLLLSVCVQPRNINFNIEMSNVANNGVILHLAEVITSDNITAPSGGDEDVSLLASIIHGGDLITLHGALQRVDGVNLSHNNTSTKGAQGLAATLADITISSNNSNLTSNHDVSSTLDTI